MQLKILKCDTQTNGRTNGRTDRSEYVNSYLDQLQLNELNLPQYALNVLFCFGAAFDAPVSAILKITTVRSKQLKNLKV